MVTPHEKIQKIFTHLKKGPIAMTALSKATGMNYQTCIAYVKMIQDIQTQPRLGTISSGKTTLVLLKED